LLFGTLRAAKLEAPRDSADQANPARRPDLVEAAKQGDLVSVRAELARRANVNAAEADGTTALHWAAYRDDVAIADALVRAGANVQAANRYGVRPLSVACENGGAAVVKRLLDAGADPNTTLAEGETALMTASRTG